ncbi:MAG: MerR family transcriptional regulator [Lactobacillus sp.]|nr:MerR family transcriptional regulator [Lactobacillus sp.]
MSESKYLNSQDLADKLGVNVNTIRRYSSLVEKVTKNDHYFKRNSQQGREYSTDDFKKLKKMQKLAKDENLSLQEACEQCFVVVELEKAEPKKAEAPDTVDQAQMELFAALKQTIDRQNTAIAKLEKQLAKIEKQNERLLSQNTMASTMTEDDLFNFQEEAKPKTEAEKRAEVEADKNRSPEEVRKEILEKAAEHQKGAARTLADMQLSDGKSHWWDRFFNF